MQKHFATAARSLNEVLQPLVRWRVEWEGGSGLCMLRTDGLCVWVKNDEPCDGGVGLECHSGLNVVGVKQRKNRVQLYHNVQFRHNDV